MNGFEPERALVSATPIPCAERILAVDAPLVRFMETIGRERRVRHVAASLGVTGWVQWRWLKIARPDILATLVMARTDGIGSLKKMPWEGSRKWALVASCRAPAIHGEVLALRRGSLCFFPGTRSGDSGGLDEPRQALRAQLAAGDPVQLSRLTWTLAPGLAKLLGAVGIYSSMVADARTRGLDPKHGLHARGFDELVGVHALGGRVVEFRGDGGLVIEEPAAHHVRGMRLLMQEGSVTAIR